MLSLECETLHTHSSKHEANPGRQRQRELASMPCCFNNLMVHWALNIHQYLMTARCKTEYACPVLLKDSLPSLCVIPAFKILVFLFIKEFNKIQEDCPEGPFPNDVPKIAFKNVSDSVDPCTLSVALLLCSSRYILHF